MSDEPTLVLGGGNGLLPPEADFLTSPAENSEDLKRILAARPPRRKLPKARLLLVFGLVLGAGFAGGIEAQKHFGTSSTSSGFPGLAALRGAGGLGGANAASTGGSGGLNPFGTGNATVGTVVLVDGSTVYVNTSNGIVKVATTSSTKVSVTESGTPAQLKPGQSIVVQGSKSSNGNVSATSISEGGLGTGGTGAGPSANG